MRKFVIIQLDDDTQTVDSLRGLGVQWDDMHVVTHSNDVPLAIARNKALEVAEGVAVILCNTVVVHDLDIFEKYEDMMGLMDVGLMTYTFSSGSNRNPLTLCPNPLMRIAYGDSGDTVLWTDTTGSDVIFVDKNTNSVKFDESKSILEFQQYIHDCILEGVIPFDGFFVEVDNSWKSFSMREGFKQRTFNVKDIETEILTVSKLQDVTTTANDVVGYTKTHVDVQKKWEIL